MQAIAKDAPHRRESNDGYRVLDVEERLLMFLARVRHKVSFKELAYQYGCGEATARRYCGETMETFARHLVPRLVFPRPPADLMVMRRDEVARNFPDLLAILDATNWKQLKPENFLENRLTYSGYKHANVFQVLFGECASVLR
jgi:hypothetical protein